MTTIYLWDSGANLVPGFEDIRAIQHPLKTQGIQLASQADELSTGPASLMVEDPGGNQILIDQPV